MIATFENWVVVFFMAYGMAYGMVFLVEYLIYSQRIRALLVLDGAFSICQLDPVTWHVIQLFSILIDFVSTSLTRYWEGEVLVSPAIITKLSTAFTFVSFALCVLSSVVMCIYMYDFYVFLMN